MIDCLPRILASGVDVNARGLLDGCALHFMVDEQIRDQEDVSDHIAVAVQCLLDYGLDTSAVDQFGRTAAQLAKENGREALASFMESAPAMHQAALIQKRTVKAPLAKASNRL